MSVSAVLFDVDGLMLDTERLAQAAWRMALDEFGYSVEDHFFLETTGRTVADIEGIFLQSYSMDFPFQDVLARRLYYSEQQYSQDGIPTKPGLFELLSFLDQYPVKKAVASSSLRALLKRKLEVSGLVHHFEVMVSGEDVSLGKPAPDIFLEAARRLGVAPEECLVLEDSPAGIQAAFDAKMIPIMVPDFVPPSPEIQRFAYRVVPSLYEIPKILIELGMIDR